MSEERNKWIDAVANMTKLTQEGQLIWTIEKLPFLTKSGPDETIDVVFRAIYKGKRLRIYKRRYKDYRPIKSSPFSGSLVLQAFGVEKEMEHYWATEVVMELVNDDGIALWTYPKVNALPDLLSAVQYQVAGVKDFLDDLLSNEQ